MAVSDDHNQHDDANSLDESDLDRYGVWVKAGPEDVVESDSEDGSFELADLGEEMLADSDESLLELDIEGDISEIGETESMDSGLEALDFASDDSSGDIADGALDVALDDDIPVADDLGDDDLSLEEISLDDVDLTETDDLADAEDAADDGLPTLDQDDLTIDFDEVVEAAPEEVVDLDDGASGEGIVDDDLSIEEDLPDDLDDLTLDLESLDVDSFDEPTTGEPVRVDDVEDADDVGEVEDIADLPEEIDLSTLPGDEPALEEFLPVESADEEEIELLELGDDAAADPDPLSDDLDLDMLDEIDSGSDLLDLSDTDEPVAPSAPAAGVGSDDRSLSLLESIERELSSIRNELADLKSELAVLRAPGASVAEETPPVSAVGLIDPDAGGFFEEEEDEDETIALTGAELDNIMNTAEFTEETGRPTEVDDLIALAGAEPTQEIQEIVLEESPEESDPIELDLGSVSEDPLAGSEDQIQALADMDIDAELAEIEELEDTTESHAMGSSSASTDDELPELEIDTEPLGDLPSDDLSDVADLSLEADLPADLSVPETPTVDVEDLAPREPVPTDDAGLPDNLKGELKSVLGYMDQLLESLPEDKIEEFAKSEHFDVYKRLFEELGLEQ